MNLCCSSVTSSSVARYTGRSLCLSAAPKTVYIRSLATLRDLCPVACHLQVSASQYTESSLYGVIHSEVSLGVPVQVQTIQFMTCRTRL